jgi:hypothetical protein
MMIMMTCTPMRGVCQPGAAVPHAAARSTQHAARSTQHAARSTQQPRNRAHHEQDDAPDHDLEFAVLDALVALGLAGTSLELLAGILQLASFLIQLVGGLQVAQLEHDIVANDVLHALCVRLQQRQLRLARPAHPDAVNPIELLRQSVRRATLSAWGCLRRGQHFSALIGQTDTLLLLLLPLTAHSSRSC